ncbi:MULTISPECIES: helix-turn-helix domain-containing protein [unclassified Streptomyces]|uniref:helix-turn-helix domain-containing protein n=1 Tax=unclassified Streptomyces TaxID=2593676 RepID=UPI000939F6BA|nr:AraC family transcriptional regulator [Streptomyces sp. CB02058]OKI93879.1 transcriptional regulator [Streptomyces sp. CB02058]
MGARYEERASRFGGAVLWTWSGARDPARPVLPDGCMDLLRVDGRLLVAGPDTHAFVPGAALAGDCAGIRFAPGTAPALLGVPAHELRDRRVALDALWPGPEVRRLTERIGAAGDPAAALEDIALRRAARAEPPDPLAAVVAAQLRQGSSVAATARAVGLGARQLHRRSLAAFGYGPKTLARVLRLQRALALVRAGTPYAEAARVAGCADQAHLAREMRDLAGTTLGGYLTATGYEGRGANSETAEPSGSRTTA